MKMVLPKFLRDIKKNLTKLRLSARKSVYYQSDEFGRMLQYMARNPRVCKLREQNGRRSVVFSTVKSVEEAWGVFEAI